MNEIKRFDSLASVEKPIRSLIRTSAEIGECDLSQQLCVCGSIANAAFKMSQEDVKNHKENDPAKCWQWHLTEARHLDVWGTL